MIERAHPYSGQVSHDFQPSDRIASERRLDPFEGLPECVNETTQRICVETRDSFYVLLSTYFSSNEIARLHEEIALSIKSARKEVVKIVYNESGGIEGYVRATPQAVQSALMAVVPAAVRAFMDTIDRDRDAA